MSRTSDGAALTHDCETAVEARASALLSLLYSVCIIRRERKSCTLTTRRRREQSDARYASVWRYVSFFLSFFPSREWIIICVHACVYKIVSARGTNGVIDMRGRPSVVCRRDVDDGGFDCDARVIQRGMFPSLLCVFFLYYLFLFMAF